jgi:hypothetical protein
MVTVSLLRTQTDSKIALHKENEGHDVPLRESKAYAPFHELKSMLSPALQSHMDRWCSSSGIGIIVGCGGRNGTMMTGGR